jgi:hypothetical protein
MLIGVSSAKIASADRTWHRCGRDFAGLKR